MCTSQNNDREVDIDPVADMLAREKDLGFFHGACHGKTAGFVIELAYCGLRP